MTTTVNLVTHGWPCEVTTTDDFTNGGTRTVTTTKERVERWQMRQFITTDTRRVAFAELTAEGWHDKPEDPKPE